MKFTCNDEFPIELEILYGDINLPAIRENLLRENHDFNLKDWWIIHKILRGIIDPLKQPEIYGIMAYVMHKKYKRFQCTKRVETRLLAYLMHMKSYHKLEHESGHYALIELWEEI